MEPAPVVQGSKGFSSLSMDAAIFSGSTSPSRRTLLGRTLPGRTDRATEAERPAEAPSGDLDRSRRPACVEAVARSAGELPAPLPWSTWGVDLAFEMVLRLGDVSGVW